ncbi:peptide deformylase 4 [Kineosporia sp. NBRC 101677]|uniref:peptide deformylase n=1 Tax=Kineosporia sp. NBRC 101677 TaxID=3032197 RepID=UPI0024A03FEB|nr:peptide deformylase [Kineosporia sp. NBRC 101677]GLY17433.1 peptide deformylase 4 [Kineosporia sp. NBRC 101677]
MTDSTEVDPDIQAWVKQAALPQGTVRKVTMRGNPVLHRPCQEVTEFGADLRQLVADMFASMEAANGVGLAANQIGVDARVFVYNCPDARDEYQTGAIVNPVLVPVPGQALTPPVEDEEGCLSVPGEYAPLARPGVAEVQGQDIDGKPLRVRGDGVLARCLQHETDHLNGLLYVDRLAGPELSRVLESLEARVRKGDLPAWSEGASS